MFRFMIIFMACFIIGESYGWEILTKCGARTQAITSSYAPIFVMPHLGALYPTCKEREREKNLVNKNQGWESIHQKSKANENTSKHNPNKKQKSTVN
jgi:hypothetical protein